MKLTKTILTVLALGVCSLTFGQFIGTRTPGSDLPAHSIVGSRAGVTRVDESGPNFDITRVIARVYTTDSINNPEGVSAPRSIATGQAGVGDWTILAQQNRASGMTTGQVRQYAQPTRHVGNWVYPGAATNNGGNAFSSQTMK